MMRFGLLLAALLLVPPTLALADPSADATQCQQGDGHFLTGTVMSRPSFKSGKPLHGVYLSHTHLTLKGDDGNTYDVAIDNVFADDYQRNQRAVPAPLSSIRVGDKLELCGKLYSTGDGIDWVHTNCGDRPEPDKPDGWVREVDASGSAGDNLEGNQAFCRLWRH
jgi:hypothetical protein